MTNTSAKYGVHSEVGKLHKVLVCSPGLAHERLIMRCDVECHGVEIANVNFKLQAPNKRQ